MKIENQVCSLDLSRKLKELGVKQESLFYWENQVSQNVLPSWRLVNYKAEISAFTVAELGEMIKPHSKSFQSFDHEGEWCCWLKDTTTHAVTEADARAKMAIYLKEQGLI